MANPPKKAPVKKRHPKEKPKDVKAKKKSTPPGAKNLQDEFMAILNKTLNG